MSIVDGTLAKDGSNYQIGGNSLGFSVEKIKNEMNIASGTVGPETINKGEVVASAPVMETKVIFFEQNADGTSEEFFLSANKLKEITGDISTAEIDIASIKATLNVDDEALNTFQELSDRLKTIVEDPDSGAEILKNIQDNANNLVTERSQTTIDIATETTRARAAELANTAAINSETTRAFAAEGLNTTAIAAEASRAGAAELANTAAIDAETARATTAEGVNTAAINSETTRAQGAETTINNRIDSEVSSRQLAIAAEASRAGAAELANTAAIDAETARATTAEGVNTAAINSEESRAIAVETENAAAISDLQNEVSQLSDKTGNTVLYDNAVEDRIFDINNIPSTTSVQVLSKLNVHWFFISLVDYSVQDLILAHVNDKSNSTNSNYSWTWADFDALHSHVYHGTDTSNDEEGA